MLAISSTTCLEYPLGCYYALSFVRKSNYKEKLRWARTVNPKIEDNIKELDEAVNYHQQISQLEILSQNAFITRV